MGCDCISILYELFPDFHTINNYKIFCSCVWIRFILIINYYIWIWKNDMICFEYGWCMVLKPLICANTIQIFNSSFHWLSNDFSFLFYTNVILQHWRQNIFSSFFYRTNTFTCVVLLYKSMIILGLTKWNRICVIILLYTI